ncbi:hypothetical protein M3P05_20655 [Sansalvadorimonas sp. 2012CJ34-2]|uniref:Uncharacterized protein n=1 Tax=Parendozoicomonas callyspongiae TaxID=2942213 RepID=A0ABT0PM47_9GAMM|nr:hypothetical protein [Sansalvadorimonas sp. 2012CJ34-2]MCL6272331.1 hypothetical protein [Sansalvadorimonas sp. 2012CJ34-2]
MEKVKQFKSTLSAIDTIFVALILLVGAAGLFLLTVNIFTGFAVLLTAVIFWIVKVLGFGIAYCTIQIAENTYLQCDDIKESNSTVIAEEKPNNVEPSYDDTHHDIDINYEYAINNKPKSYPYSNHEWKNLCKNNLHRAANIIKESNQSG